MLRLAAAALALAAMATSAMAQTPSSQVTVPSAQNSGAGIPGQPGNKNGPAATTGAGSQQSPADEAVRQQDPAKIPGLPGSKSGPAAKPPSSGATERFQGATGR